MIYQVKTQSGLTGWRTRLQENYEHNFNHWRNYANMYGLHAKLGFKSPRTAWNANPPIEGSVNTADYRLAPKSSKLWGKRKPQIKLGKPSPSCQFNGHEYRITGTDFDY